MRNLTLSLEDDVYRRARVIAAEADTSVTALVREFLEVLANGEGAPGKTNKAILNTIDRLRAKHPHFDPENRLSRDELHERVS